MHDRTCNFPGCSNLVTGEYRRTRCDTHRLRKNIPLRECSVSGCGNQVSTRYQRRCDQHRANNRPNPRPCAEPGCRTTITGNYTITKCPPHRRKFLLRQRQLADAAAATTDECLFLTGVEERFNVKHNGRGMAASRAVWSIANGGPGDLHVLHTCNGGSGAHGCINIRHLYLGDNAQNVADKVAAGRQATGADNGMLKLTDDQVREIRARFIRGNRWSGPGNMTELAGEYDVTPWMVSAIANRIRRQSVQD